MNQITDHLWVSDIQTVREGSTAMFDRVVTVCQESVEENVGCAYECYTLADGPHSVGRYGGECSYELFSEAAGAVVDALDDGDIVLVHCHMGRSRAPSVAAAALGVHEDRTYHGAFGIVGQHRPQTNPDDTLKAFARQYIETYRDVAAPR